MNRQTLLSALSLASGAVAQKDFIPILTCFCFDGTTLHAYDDAVAIVTPCKTDFTGAIKADPLLKFLKASKAKEIELTEEGGKILVTAAKANLELDLMDAAEFVFAMPNEDAAEVLSNGLVDGLRRCLPSMSQDTTYPAYMGVTVGFAKGKMNLYSTNNILATEATVEAKVPKALANVCVQLSPAFVRALCAISQPITKFLVGDGWFSAQLADETVVFGRTLANGDAAAFRDRFESVAERCEFQPLPVGFDRMIARALAVASDDTAANLTTGNGRLNMHTKSALGEVKDAVKWEGSDVTAALVVSLTAKILEGVTEISFVGDEFLCMKHEWDGLRIVSLVTSND